MGTISFIPSLILASYIGEPHPQRERKLEQLATDRVVSYLNETKDHGRLVYPLVEFAEETALSPDTTEAVITTLETDGPYTVRRLSLSLIISPQYR